MSQTLDKYRPKASWSTEKRRFEDCYRFQKEYEFRKQVRRYRLRKEAWRDWKRWEDEFFADWETRVLKVSQPRDQHARELTDNRVYPQGNSLWPKMRQQWLALGTEEERRAKARWPVDRQALVASLPVLGESDNNLRTAHQRKKIQSGMREREDWKKMLEAEDRLWDGAMPEWMEREIEGEWNREVDRMTVD